MKPSSKKLLSAMIAGLVPMAVATGGMSNAFAQEESNSGRIEEVMVTARKIEESLQEVPVAVTAVSAEMIDSLGIQSLSDISKVTAGLVFDQEFGRGANRPVIRGQANILGNSGVSYFIDGVYITGSIDSYDLNDVERVEVAKGPQSALYGRNTYSGAINIITRSPSSSPGGRVKVELAEDQQYDISASLRGGSDTVSGGISVRHYELGGPFTNTWDGSDIGEQESNSVSGVLEFNPSEDLRIRARAYYSERDDGQPAIFATRTTDNNCYPDIGSALYNGNGRYYCGVVDVGPVNMDWPVQAPGARETDDDLQLSLNISYEINDSWSLTSVTGYNDNEGFNLTDGDYFPDSFQVTNFTPTGFPFAGFPVPPFGYAWVGSITDFTFASEGESDDISQEIRFEYTGDNMRALFGAYYFDQDSTTRNNREITPEMQAIADANFGAEAGRMAALCALNPICAYMVPFSNSSFAVSRDVNKLNIRNTALFGLMSWDLSDRFTLTAEARWQEEKIKQNAILQNVGGMPAVVPESNATFDSFLPRVTVDYRLTDENMIYALYAEGTKPGGFNGTVAIEAGIPTFDEEDVESFEVGSKNVLMDGRVVANFAAYYNQVSGYQLSQLVQSEGNSLTATVNAGDADIYGLEAEIMAKLTDNLTLTFNYAITHSEFVKGRDQNQGVINDVADNGIVDCSTGDEFPDDADCTSAFGSIVGKQVPRTAKNQAFLDLEYRAPMNNGWEWYLGGNYAFESSKFAQVHNLAETGDASLFNARLGFAHDNWSVQLWGRNLSNETATYNILRYAEAVGFTRNFAAAPRRQSYYGITAIYNW